MLRPITGKMALKSQYRARGNGPVSFVARELRKIALRRRLDCGLADWN
jgi:hypothetical protein